MRVYSAKTEIALVPDTDDDKKVLEQFMSAVIDHRVAVDWGGSELDELVFDSSLACEE